MKTSFHSLLSLLIGCLICVQAKEAVTPAHYVEATSIDQKALLPGPPAVGSLENQKEIELVLARQKSRTSAEVARAQSEVKLNVWIFADVLGPWFTAANLPGVETLCKNVDEDTHNFTEISKELWQRPRPPYQDSHIQPVLELKPSFSYPSGHSTHGYLFSLILAELVPAQKEKLLRRGTQIGDDRVLGGVHFPSDVAAGRTLAQAIFTKLMANPAFQADMAQAKIEVAAAKKS